MILVVIVLLLAVFQLNAVKGTNNGESNHPFFSDFCLNMVENYPENKLSSLSSQNVIIALPVHNPNKQLLLQSMKSMLKDYSNTVATKPKLYPKLNRIHLLDDASSEGITTWVEWKSMFTDQELNLISFSRNPAKQGMIKSKNQLIATIKDDATIKDSFPSFSAKDNNAAYANTNVVFLNAPVIVTPQWLLPLLTTVVKYPNTLAYPSIDVLVENKNGWEVVRSQDSLVAGFDWSLKPRWEDASASTAGITASSNGYEWLSPSLPQVFMVKLKYLLSLGDFDALLRDTTASLSADTSSSPAQQLYYYENIELALRAWLCEGTVIKNSCSRVAAHFANLHLDSDLSAAPEVVAGSQYAHDFNAMLIAQKYMQVKPLSVSGDVGSSNSYKEVVFQARFTHRLPYNIELPADVMTYTPTQSFYLSSNSGSKKSRGIYCTSFAWYLQHVYPQLVAQASGVTQTFAQSLLQEKEKHLDSVLALHYLPLSSSGEDSGVSKWFQSNDMEMLSSRAKLLLQNANNILGIPANSNNENNENSGFVIRKHFIAPASKNKVPSREELLAFHSNLVREDLVCQDFTYSAAVNNGHGKEMKKVDFCAEEIPVGQRRALCQTSKGRYLLSCPKTCGFCEQGKTFCEDFFLNKCKQWASEGLCDKEVAEYGKVQPICRKSCQVCVPDYISDPGYYTLKSEKADEHGHSLLAMNNGQKVEVSTGKRLGAVSLSVNHNAVKGDSSNGSGAEAVLMVDGVDVFAPHKHFLAGRLPDEFLAESERADNCAIKGNADAQLLDRVQLHPSHADSKQDKGVRIFCGIYTYAKNHATNVRATMYTWAKKCDGFLAFSTQTDAALNAVNLTHEGDESYDNMWQKSRSIWKLVHQHLRDSFDYFLLGGDDMFYIVENLRAYLNSEEIVQLQQNSQGLFLGRVFQPPNQVVFNSGGAGYLLDRKALQVLNNHIDSNECFPHQRGFWEDVNVASCLQRSTERIMPHDTRDSQQRERFHPFNPGNHLNYRIPKNPDWYAKYNPNLKVGVECCSDYSISFHYLPAKSLYTMYDYLYHCPSHGH